MIALTNHDENSLESWDRRYNVFFGFPKVFTALSEIDDDVIRKDVREELIYALQEVWRQLDSELGENRTYVHGVDFTPLCKFKQLRKEDFHPGIEDGNERMVLGDHISDEQARLFADYGAIKMFTLQLISQGPFGPAVRTIYHTVLAQILEYMGRHLPKLDSHAIMFNNKAGGIYNAEVRPNPIEAIAKALYRGLA
tara:strand:- start:822 stop:1409 length:588 start_codon:yes stop_codon:yes gene_type:complete